MSALFPGRLLSAAIATLSSAVVITLAALAAFAPLSPLGPLGPTSLLAPTPAFAQTNGDAVQRLITDSRNAINGWSTLIDGVEKRIERFIANGEAPPEIRDELEPVRQQAIDLSARITPSIASAQELLDALGPPPDPNGQTSELPSVASERERLTSQLNTLTALRNRARLTRERIEVLFDRADRARRSFFQARLLDHNETLLTGQFWLNLPRDLARTGTQISQVSYDWMQRARPWWPLAGVLALALGLGLATRAGVQHWRRQRAEGGADPSSFLERAQSGLKMSVARALPAVIAVAILPFGFSIINLMPLTVAPIVQGLAWGVAVYFVLWAIAKSILAPNHSGWRLLSLSDDVARGLYVRLHWLIAVAGIDIALAALLRGVVAPASVTTLLDILFAVVSGLLLMSMLRMAWRHARQDDAAGPASGPAAEADVAHYWWPIWLKVPLWLVAIAVVLAPLAGYVVLGRFMAEQILLLLGLSAAVWLAHEAVNTGLRAAITEDQPFGRWLANGLGFGETQRDILATALAVLFDITLLIAVVPVLLLQWGYSISTVQAWLHAAIFGFKIGDVELSLTRIGIAIAIFAGILFIIRAIQRWFDRRIVQPQRVDAGLANSLSTGIGYVGFLLATVAGISYAGLDFTNLAIVAGALSVGIGFGLQSIVNNFVSGLILLIERPIKIGDWVIAGDAQGYVRRISVRSTEIETFDRATVIVPNADLISNRVTNWTHRNSVGRVVIRIGVSYGADPDQVIDILTKTARNHPLILGHPAPFVVFEDFGSSALDFSLRCYIADVNNLLSVSSELRLGLLRALRSAQIEIPFPQQDVHLRDLDNVKSGIASALERARAEIRARQAAQATPTSQSEPPTDRGPATPTTSDRGLGGAPDRRGERHNPSPSRSPIQNSGDREHDPDATGSDATDAPSS